MFWFLFHWDIVFQKRLFPQGPQGFLFFEYNQMYNDRIKWLNINLCFLVKGTEALWDLHRASEIATLCSVVYLGAMFVLKFFFW